MDIFAVDQDFAGGRFHQAVDHFHGCRFPAAAWADQHQDLASVDMQIEAFNDRVAGFICFTDILEFNHENPSFLEFCATPIVGKRVWR